MWLTGCVNVSVLDPIHDVTELTISIRKHERSMIILLELPCNEFLAHWVNPYKTTEHRYGTLLALSLSLIFPDEDWAVVASVPLQSTIDWRIVADQKSMPFSVQVSSNFNN